MSTATMSDAPLTIEDAEAQAARTDEAPAPAKRVRKARKARTRTPAAPRAPKADKAPAGPRPAPLKKRLQDFITSMGAMLLLVHPGDGQLVIAGAERQAHALDALAKENPAVRRALESLLTVSIYGQLLTAFAPTLLGIAANHGKVPPMVAQLVGSAMGQPMPSDAGAGIDLGALAGMFAGGAGEADGAPFGAVVGMG